MFLSRIELDPAAASEPSLWKRFYQPYEFHSLLWQCFSDGPERERDFIYRQEGRRAYALSLRPPVSPGRGWRVESKPFSPRLKPGQRLGFLLRANPVVSRRDNNNKQRRHDLVMEAKTDLKKQGLPKDQWPPQSELVREAGLKWLLARSGPNGFNLEKDSFTADGYHQVRFPKKGRLVSISVLDMGGVLRVEDVDAFTAMLGRGLGPAKGFGCGLFLIRRA